LAFRLGVLVWKTIITLVCFALLFASTWLIVALFKAALS